MNWSMNWPLRPGGAGGMSGAPQVDTPVVQVLAATHHARSLNGLREVSCVRLAPEHVTLKSLRAAVYDHSEGVAVVADAQKGEETHLTLPERLLPFLPGSNHKDETEWVTTFNLLDDTLLMIMARLPVPSTETGRYRWRGWRLAPTRHCLWSSWCFLWLGSIPPYLQASHKHTFTTTAAVQSVIIIPLWWHLLVTVITTGVF